MNKSFDFKRHIFPDDFDRERTKSKLSPINQKKNLLINKGYPNDRKFNNDKIEEQMPMSRFGHPDPRVGI